MLSFLKKLLSESPEFSAMRFMSIVSLLVASTLAFIGLFKDVDLGSLATLCGVFLGAGFIGKATQKFAESDKEVPPPPPVTKDDKKPIKKIDKRQPKDEDFSD
jgi:hypothetical protein